MHSANFGVSGTGSLNESDPLEEIRVGRILLGYTSSVYVIQRRRQALQMNISLSKFNIIGLWLSLKDNPDFIFSFPAFFMPLPSDKISLIPVLKDVQDHLIKAIKDWKHSAVTERAKREESIETGSGGSLLLCALETASLVMILYKS